MKTILGIMVILIAIVLGLWLGFCVFLVGGIMNIVHVIQGSGGAGTVLLGIIKIGSAGFVGWLSFLLGASVGYGILKS